MHSSRMCTIRSSSHVYPSMQWAGAVCIPACTGQGVYPGMHWGRHPPVNRMTERCKTLPCCNYVVDGKYFPDPPPPPIWKVRITSPRAINTDPGCKMLNSSQSGTLYASRLHCAVHTLLGINIIFWQFHGDRAATQILWL